MKLIPTYLRSQEAKYEQDGRQGAAVCFGFSSHTKHHCQSHQREEEAGDTTNRSPGKNTRRLGCLVFVLPLPGCNTASLPVYVYVIPPPPSGIPHP
ncbi:hypothetical protein BaRGS_00001941 [Batillaria attramentaria]|uniref:Uncharacterized protein n=1 Tax=Batillaria attramentaria TaxID=370345 RepID=A0ABD0M6F8_9CAEN